jgi:hypothetical protein
MECALYRPFWYLFRNIWPHHTEVTHIPHGHRARHTGIHLALSIICKAQKVPHYQIIVFIKCTGTFRFHRYIFLERHICFCIVATIQSTLGVKLKP